MDETEAKLLAMLIDTEGCISAGESGSSRNFRPTIGVSMRSEIPVIYARKWGGYLYKRLTPCHIVDKKEVKLEYRWLLGPQRKLRFFLQKIKPYLINKQKQAEIALEMLDVIQLRKEGYRERLKQLKTELCELNHLSPPDIDLTELEVKFEGNRHY